MLENNYRKTKKVTVNGAVVNGLLGVAKVVVGFIGNSQAVLADGLHSLSDLLTDILVVITAKIGSNSPDLSHPYGHGRVETIGSAILGIVLIIVGLGVVYDAIHHIFLYRPLRVAQSLIIVTLASIVSNEALFRYTMKAANTINSNLLRANAWHKRTDALSSVVVLIGVIGSMFGVPYLDAIAATIVAILILKMGGKMVLASVQELIDTGLDEKTLLDLQKEVRKIGGVDSVHQVRSRAVAGMFFVELHIQVDPYISASESHFISDQVSKKLLNKFSHLLDVIVHVDIENDEVSTDVKIFSSLPSRAKLMTELEPIWKDLPGYSKIKNWQFYYIADKVEIELLMPIKVLDEIDPVIICLQYRKAASGFSVIHDVKIHFDSEA